MLFKGENNTIKAVFTWLGLPISNGQWLAVNNVNRRLDVLHSVNLCTRYRMQHSQSLPVSKWGAPVDTLEFISNVFYFNVNNS